MRNVVEAVKNHANIDKAYETFVDFFEALVAYHNTTTRWWVDTKEGEVDETRG